MADVGDNVEISIGAKIDEATAAVAELKGAFEGFSRDVQKHFSEMGQASSALLGKITSLVEGFLSFEAAKRSVEMVKDLGVETEKFATRLGIGQSEASQFIVAIDDVHASVEQVMGVMQRQNRQMKANEDGMNAMGIKTRDANGDLLGQQEILLNSIEALKGYKEGTDRNQASMVAFGGRVGDLTALMKLNRAGIEEARQKADDLNLTLTQQGVAAVAEYRKAMNDVDDVIKGLQKTLGEALMPIITDVGKWFAGVGKEAIQGFSVSVKIVASAVNGLVLAFQVAFEVIVAGMQIVAVRAVSFATAVGKALMLDFSGAQAAWDAGTTHIQDIVHRSFDRIMEDAQNTKKRLEDLWSPDKTKAAAPSGGKAFVPRDKGAEAADLDTERQLAKKRMEEQLEFLKGEVAAKRMTEEQKADLSLLEMEKLYQIESDLLERKKNLYRAGTAEYRKAMNEIRVLDAQHDVDVEKGIVEIEDARRKDNAERVAMTAAALKQEVEIAKEGQKQVQAYLEQQVQTGIITAEKKLQIERDLLQRVYELELAALQQEAALYSDPTQVKERQKVLDQIEKLTVAHNVALQKNTNDSLTELGKRWTTMLDSVSKAFDTSIKGIIIGTTSLRQAMANIGQSILAEFVNLGVKMVEEWVIQEIKKTAVTEAGVAARTAAEQEGAATSIITWAFAAVKNIMASAWEAMAAAFKAIVGIPFVGPALAPAAGAAAFAAVAGMAGSVSAAGGYDIPQGVNPVVQAHSREMILPPKLSEGVRNMVERGGGGGDIHLSITAVDAQSVRRLFMDHGPALSDAIRRQARNLTPTVPK